MKTISVLLLFLMSGCGIERDLYTLSEMAYFEGQKDALQGKIKIKKTADSCWVWTSSPWPNGQHPIYNPSSKCY